MEQPPIRMLQDLSFDEGQSHRRLVAALPLISLPSKGAKDVDWTGCIRGAISEFYGFDPNNYVQECQQFEQCRKLAIEPIENVATDALHRYLGQLELVELRFPQAQPSFQWRDAFTGELATCNSIAYEKACIVFQIAAANSVLAARHDTERAHDLKLSVHRFRTSAGLLTYILENLSPLPSCDFSQDLLKFLSDLMLTQAIELCCMKYIADHKGSKLAARLAAQAALMNSGLVAGAEILEKRSAVDRNWLKILKMKSDSFFSLAQFIRSEVDVTSEMYGTAVARLTVAEDSARAASKVLLPLSLPVLRSSRDSAFDRISAFQEAIQSHIALCNQKKDQARRWNDFIYNLDVSKPTSLPRIEGVMPIEPIKIDNIFSVREVCDSMGPDLFGKLVPLIFREAFEKYLKERGELLKSEAEKVEEMELEKSSILQSLGIQEGLRRFKTMLTILETPQHGTPQVLEVEDMYETVRRTGGLDDRLISRLLSDRTHLHDTIRNGLERLDLSLAYEKRVDRPSRARPIQTFVYSDSNGRLSSLLEECRLYWKELQEAELKDQQIVSSWDRIKGDIQVLLSSETSSIVPKKPAEIDCAVYEKLLHYIQTIERHISALDELCRKRMSAFAELKDQVRLDDISSLFIPVGNKKIEPSFFHSELGKFMPSRNTIAAAVQSERDILMDVKATWNGLGELAREIPALRTLEEQEKRRETMRERFRRTYKRWEDTRHGLTQSVQNYRMLSESIETLTAKTNKFVVERKERRKDLEIITE